MQYPYQIHTVLYEKFRNDNSDHDLKANGISTMVAPNLITQIFITSRQYRQILLKANYKGDYNSNIHFLISKFHPNAL